MKSTKLQVVILVAISVLAGYGLGKTQSQYSSSSSHVNFINKTPPSGVATVDMSQFWNVWQRITDNYYDKKVVDPQKMLNGAITGMVASLGDPYTLYLPPAQQTNFQQQLSGKFGGIGAELGQKDKQIIVIAPLNDSPAQKAGIKAGDALIKVDGTSTAGWTLQQAVEKIRGPKGTTVTLTIVHKDEQDSKDIKIGRDTITVKSIEGWIKSIKDIDGLSSDIKTADSDKKVMYLRLSQFGDDTNKDWTALLAKLNPQYTSDVKGVILDLRNNPGGYLTDATYIASEFLPLNDPVVIQDPGNDNKTTLSVTRQGTLLDKPLVVLINKGSASASEIVSGALRDHNRAKLIGDTSFGKGTIQEALDLGSGSGLHVTIAKWLTPNGTWVHGKGLTPDIKVSLDEKDPSHDAQLEKAIQTLVE